jgi:hypothetical protein
MCVWRTVWLYELQIISYVPSIIGSYTRPIYRPLARTAARITIVTSAEASRRRRWLDAVWGDSSKHHLLVCEHKVLLLATVLADACVRSVLRSHTIAFYRLPGYIWVHNEETGKVCNKLPSKTLLVELTWLTIFWITLALIFWHGNVIECLKTVAHQLSIKLENEGGLHNVCAAQLNQVCFVYH